MQNAEFAACQAQFKKLFSLAQGFCLASTLITLSAQDGDARANAESSVLPETLRINYRFLVIFVIFLVGRLLFPRSNCSTALEPYDPSVLGGGVRWETWSRSRRSLGFGARSAAWTAWKGLDMCG